MSVSSQESTSHSGKRDLFKRFCQEIDYIHFPPNLNFSIKNQIKDVMFTKGFEIVDSAMNNNTYEQLYALKSKVHITFWESTYKIHIEILLGSESYPNKCPSFKVLCPLNYKPNPTSKIIDSQCHVLTYKMKQWDQDHQFSLLDLLKDIKYQFECCFPYVSKEHIIDNNIRSLYLQGQHNENLFSPQTLLQVSVYERDVKHDIYNSRSIYSIRDGMYNGDPVTIYLYNNTSLETKIYIDRAICTYINLRHPHLISTYGKCMYNSIYPCIVLESHHISLFQYIKSLHDHPLSDEDKKEMILQIADGLMYIHDHHFIHRNLNPHCIFLCHGMLKIGGYEYIRNTLEQGDLSNTGECIYKAPEQVLYHNLYSSNNNMDMNMYNLYNSTDNYSYNGNSSLSMNSGMFNTNNSSMSLDSMPEYQNSSINNKQMNISENNSSTSLSNIPNINSNNNSSNFVNSSDGLSVSSMQSSASSTTRQKHILEYNQSVDIHAFALIVYFIYTSEEPFDGEWNDRIYLAFFKQNIRPTVPSYVPHAITNLITHCWNPKPEKRPNIKAVYNYIYNFKPSNTN